MRKLNCIKGKTLTLFSQQIDDFEKESLDILVKGQDLDYYAMHVGMDAYYAAVEMRDDPSVSENFNKTMWCMWHR